MRTLFALLCLSLAAIGQSDLRPVWEVGYREQVKLTVTIRKMGLEGKRRTWSYTEEYDDVVKEAADGRPVVIERHYRKHKSSPSLLSGGSKAEKELAKRNPDIEGKTLLLDVAGGRVKPRGKLDRAVKRFLALPGTLNRWELLLPVKPGTQWIVKKDAIAALVPAGLLGKPKRGDGMFTRKSKDNRTVTAGFIGSFIWRPDSKTAIEALIHGDLVFDLEKRCVSSIKLSGTIGVGEDMGTFTLELTVKRQVPGAK